MKEQWLFIPLSGNEESVQKIHYALHVTGTLKLRKKEYKRQGLSDTRRKVSL